MTSSPRPALNLTDEAILPRMLAAAPGGQPNWCPHLTDVDTAYWPANAADRIRCKPCWDATVDRIGPAATRICDLCQRHRTHSAAYETELNRSMTGLPSLPPGIRSLRLVIRLCPACQEGAGP